MTFDEWLARLDRIPMVECDRCRGRGHVLVVDPWGESEEEPCWTCGGCGHVPEADVKRLED